MRDKIQDLRSKMRAPAARKMLAAAALLSMLGLIVVKTTATPREHWEIRGTMSEACTCQAPCGCNFRSGPSPRHFCWSLASFDIQKGHYGGVKLNGLHLVRAHGGKATVWYVDDQATPRQEDALRAIAGRLSQSAGRFEVHFEKARITQTFGEKEFQVGIGEKGGFDADEIIGMDGKNPIVVENMTAWNVQRDIKGRTKRLRYQDEFGNEFDMTNTNANQGRFDWTDRTPAYF